MGEVAYSEALKLGKREYKACVISGRFPYLPVLDDILTREEIQTEQHIGLVQVPLDFVVGTATRGRTSSFAANFMPILNERSEFAIKWANLANAQVNEGIRDAIIAYEYRNRYYVVEGNKRVSVLKYFKADSILADVTRKVPKYSEEEDIKLYYEYMKFNELTGVNSVEFSKLGMAEKLIALMGDVASWGEEKRQAFASLILHFTKAYNFRGGNKLPIRTGDALTAFVNVYGYDAAVKMTDAELNSSIIKCWNEFVALSQKQSVGLVMDPRKVQKKWGLIHYLLSNTSQKLTAAFLYAKAPENSAWIYAHELGRNYLEEMFPDQIETLFVPDVSEDNIEAVINDVLRRGADIIFEVGPQLMRPSLKIAVDHPDVKFLNCSLNTPHRYIRTYYSRMYEAKFLSGMIAGALAENDRIAYIADYPIYGMIANINAFALGASYTNPRAEIYLEWSTRKGYDRQRFLDDNKIRIVSDQDMTTPQEASRQFGLYIYENGEPVNLVMPIWNWGIFYEKMIQSILAGAYQTEEEARALNYWWGMSAGVIDLICSKRVPAGVQSLVEHFKEDIKGGFMAPFYGEVRAQDGSVKNQKNQYMSPEDIMEMDYLVENIIGNIPEMDTLVEKAKSVVMTQGVEEIK